MATRKCVGMSFCGVIGVVFVVVGCFLITVFSNLIHSEVEDSIPLKKGSKTYDLWKAPTSPILFQVWMFDYVNPYEILQGGQPVVMQIGPYTYREKREKFNISFNANGTLFYRERRSFVFDRELSVGSENDTFMSVNIPMLTIAEITKRETKVFKEIVNLAFKAAGENLFLNMSVGGLMWGYDDPLLKTIGQIAKDFHFNLSLPEKFGLFIGQNGTDDGIYEIYSGAKGVKNFGEIITWNYMKKLKWWTDERANAINGSDGTIYPPFIDTKDTKYLFSSDLCRSLGIEYTKPVTVRGIDLKQFVAPDIMFANVSTNPYNAGFCTPKGNCLPSGLLNASVCRDGAPIVMSMPHFLGCDKSTQTAVRGLHPNREEHQSYVDIEPLTGVVMNAGKKLQINLHVEPIEGYTDTEKINPIFLPVMWLNESAMISNKDAKDFKSEVLSKITLTQAIQYGLIALGAFLVACVLVIVIKGKVCPKPKALSIRDDYDEPLLNAAGPIST